VSKRALALALLVALAATACRRERAAPPAPSGPGQREVLLAKIAMLDEVADCAASGGPSGLRLVDAELAGEAAMVKFECGGGAVSGKVTFFLLGGTWAISTKEIAHFAPGMAQSARAPAPPARASD
jgi:hypothetical protein